jgi:hypothetical protein
VQTEEAAVDMKKFRNRAGLQVELMMLNYDWLRRNFTSAKPHAASSQRSDRHRTLVQIFHDQEGSGLHSTIFTCTDEELNPSLHRIIQ